MELFQQQIDGYGEVVSANSTKTTPIEESLPIRVTVMYEVKDNACLSHTNKKCLLKARTPVICPRWQEKNKDCFMPFSAYEPFANFSPSFHL